MQGLGGVLRHGVLPAPDLATVAKFPMSGNWPHNGYNKEVCWQEFLQICSGVVSARRVLLSSLSACVPVGHGFLAGLSCLRPTGSK